MTGNNPFQRGGKSSDLCRFQPFHDHKPGYPPIDPCFRLRGPGDGRRFVEVAKPQPGSEESAHVSAEWTMVILDSNSSILDPHHALLQIVVDGIMKMFPTATPNPTAVYACCVEAVQIRNQQGAARFQHSLHLTNPSLYVGNINQRQVANHQVDTL